jgi:hypothetical protein
MKVKTTEVLSHLCHKYTISYIAGVKGMADKNLNSGVPEQMPMVWPSRLPRRFAQQTHMEDLH